MNPLTATMLMKSVKLMKKRIKKWFVCSRKFKCKLHNLPSMTFPRYKSLLRKIRLSKVIIKMNLITVLNKQTLPFFKMERNHPIRNKYQQFKRKILLLKIKTIFHQLITKNLLNQGKNFLILDLTVTKRKIKKN